MKRIRYLLRLLGPDSFDEQPHHGLVKIQLDAGHLGEARRHDNIYVSSTPKR